MTSNDFSDLRDQNTKLNVEEFEQGKSFLQSYPQALFVELTENCNFSCGMCRTGGKFNPSKNMSFDTFRNIADELFPFANLVDLRGWGESTILKSFQSFVDYALPFGCQLRLVTNLSIPNDDFWRSLVEQNFIISASFDAVTPKTFSNLRKGSNFKRIVHNLKVVAEHSQKLHQDTNKVWLNVAVQKEALMELEDMVLLAAEIGVKVIHYQVVVLEEDHPNNLSKHIPRVIEVLDKIHKVANELDVTLIMNTALDETLAVDEAVDKTCIHPWMYCYFNYKGEVGFCDHLIGTPSKDYLIGDLNKDTFKSIWNNNDYIRLRSEHLSRKRGISEQFEECNWCYKNRYIDFDHLIYKPYKQHIVSNRNRVTLYTPPSKPS